MDEISSYQYGPQRPRSKKKYIFYSVLITAILLVSYFGVYAGWAYKNVRIDNRATQGKTGDTPVIREYYEGITDGQNLIKPKRDPRRLNVLLLGLRGEEDTVNGGLLTDSIILLSLDKDTGRTAMISVPRDLFVYIKNRFGGKINEVYEIGLIKGEGADFTKDIFSRVTGVYIDNIIVSDFEAFTKIIDAIGGVDVTLDKPFSETLQWGYTFYIPAGENHLTSEQALYYARSRYSTSDFDRARRQQQIIIAVKDKILSLGVIGNPSKLNSFVANMGDSIKSDASILDLKDIVGFASSLNSTDNPPRQYVLSTDNVLVESIQRGIYILQPKENDFKNIHEVVENIFK